VSSIRNQLRKLASPLGTWAASGLICALIACLYLLGALDFIERQISAARFGLLKSDPSGNIVVVAIDAPSLKQMPVWPWPRAWHAEIIDRLNEAGARNIIFDVDFSAASAADQDAMLAAALKRAEQRVILPVFQQHTTDGGETLATAPLAEFARHAMIASANVRGDPDGVVRHMSRYERWSGVYVPTIAQAAAGLQSRLTGRFLIDFGIRADKILVVSYVDLLKGKTDPAIFAGKTVLIGSSALELGDNLAVATRGVMPGVIVQALAAESLIQGRDLRQVTPLVVVPLCCLLFVLIVRVGRTRGKSRGLVAGLLSAGAVTAVSLGAQAFLPLQLDTAPLLVAIAAAVLTSLVRSLRDLDLRLIGQALLLRQTEVLMRQVVASSTDGVLVLDDNGKVRSVNPAAERMMGEKAATLVGEHFFDLMATPMSTPPLASLTHMAANDQATQIELTRPDGSTVIVDVSVSRIPDHPTASFVAQMHDVTEMKRREAELRAARDQAEAASNSKSQFLANMSHELRTPLNAVIGFSEIMKAEILGPIGTESYRGYSVSIHDSAKHLLGIINDILDISSIESGTPRLYEDVHAPEQLCQSVVALVQGRADTAQVALKIMVDPMTDLLHADGRMVKQMLINLVGNAIKFSPKRGSIEIKVAPTGDGQGGMIFSVVDHGIGIAKDDIPRILKPFEQVETAFSRNYDGVGLGLPLVNSMARLHGALLAIDSELQKGTTASILFPPSRVKPREAPPAAAATHVHSLNLGRSQPRGHFRAAE
jgi:PAS domain S-box-containing protein